MTRELCSAHTREPINSYILKLEFEIGAFMIPLGKTNFLTPNSSKDSKEQLFV